MKVTIDNLDGSGAIDFTAKIEFGAGATIRRALYQPTLCSLTFILTASDTPPVREGRVAIADCTGTPIFTGYISEAPEWELFGQDTSGPVYRLRVTAVSDEAALDADASPVESTLLGQSAAQSWGTLAATSSKANLFISLSGQFVNASRVEIKKGDRWSEAAKSVGVSTRSAYRAIAGTVRVSSIGEITHTIAGDDAGFTFEPTHATDLRWLARDVTVIGAEEPKAYVTEIFQGDGITTAFAMTTQHFVPVQSQRATVADTFQGTALNPRLWAVSDAAGHIALTAGGLSCLGGTGRDAESTVSSVHQMELGGNVTLEATGVQIGTGSVGKLLCLYAGLVDMNQCFAGFGVSSSGASVSLNPLIQGVVAGSSFQVQQGRMYTLRLRLSSLKGERIRQTYTYVTDQGAASLGGEVVASSGYLQLEVQDTTSGAASAPIVLYAGSISAIPAACVLVMLSSGSLVCSMKSMKCVQAAPLHVTLAASGASAVTQFDGMSPEGGSCRVTAGGTLEFYPSSIPPAGSLISVMYRSRGRAVSRRALPQTPEGSSFFSAQTWIGSVDGPAAWSSTDCDRAAAALLQMSSSSSAALKGRYVSTVQVVEEDIWPGDVLAINPGPDGQTAEVVVRNVEIAMLGGEPSSFAYTVRFANDWAESLSIHLSPAIPEDAVLPQQSTAINSALDSLSALTITSLTSTSLSLDTGIYAPINGGFEVRRRDDTFGPGLDSDLILRASARSLTISRTSAVEQFYVRMYDGAVPPNYSLVSAAVFTNVPM